MTNEQQPNDRDIIVEMRADMKNIKETMSSINLAISAFSQSCVMTRDGFQQRLSKVEQAIDSREKSDARMYKLFGLMIAILSMAAAIGLIKGGV